MNYIQYTFTVTPPEPGSDILISSIAEMGFESFENTDKGFVAYIPENLSSEINLNDFTFDDFSYVFTHEKMAKINWNEEWEKNFDPVIINDSCIIRALFHTLEKKYTYDIVIMPKMSFGTGHHDTTWLMCKNMLEYDFKNKTVFDMGCGTGVLSILAKKLGAHNITGNDIDEWSVENAIENCANNNCSDIKIVEGSSNLLSSKKNHYDVILANINKNVLKNYLPAFSGSLKSNAHLFISGFFKTDCAELINLASTHCFKLRKQELKNDWAMLILQKV
ncbi:MAG TPA: 50S ribosomal protein L11 methyltransferase [Bacteroidia bacterium]|jgi:ribosomal protein L11 methyltransferase|nr:50S ribosomal protein L11 methyltransferase [Bacteroidia bacterium]